MSRLLRKLTGPLYHSEVLAVRERGFISYVSRGPLGRTYWVYGQRLWCSCTLWFWQRPDLERLLGEMEQSVIEQEEQVALLLDEDEEW